MKTILAPVDFSETSTNAVHYALKLAKQVGVSKIILYHAYQMPVTTIDPMIPNIQIFNLEDEKKLVESQMDDFVSPLKEFANSEINLESICEFNTLTAGIETLLTNIDIDFVIMGITGGGAVEEVMIGSNTVTVAKNIEKPVIIVPPKCIYKPIRKIMLACDMKKVVESTPIRPIKKLLDLTHSELHIVNISKYNDDMAKKDFEALMLDSLFQGYNPTFHFVESEDFLNAINHYAIDNNIDIIITIPKHHGWFESLFKRSHTIQLAFHSDVPLMVIH